ncbi:hypothetical protein SteCoe_37646 [Stentor coeruleus]|uniref:Uncharacterized protein n=1 Tax=Stentor coeruleus TaxID=5963 RepID=A0A1R2AMM4_9CILI|nr:hypothetical protein SteCoe_37646 [Stentor coeruleus]
MITKNHTIVSQKQKYCNICMYLDRFGYSLLKLYTKNKFIKSLQQSVLKMFAFQHAIKSKILCNDIKSEENELEKISKSRNPIERLFRIINKIAEKEKLVWTPVKENFQLPLIENIASSKGRKFIASETFSLKILSEDSKVKETQEPWPSILCLNVSNISLKGFIKKVVNLSNPLAECVYCLNLLVFEKNDDVEFLQIDNSFNLDKGQLDFDIGTLKPDAKIKYLFYLKSSKNAKFESFKRYLNTIWMNFFIIDSWFISIMKLNSIIPWMKKVKFSFIEIEKQRLLIKERLKHDKKNNNREKTSEKTTAIMDPSYFESITEEFLNYSIINLSSENLNCFTAFEKILEEFHFYKRNEYFTCTCIACDNFKRLGSSMIYHKKIIDLELKEPSTFNDFFIKARKIFPKCFFIGIPDVVSDKTIKPEVYKMYMHLKMYFIDEDYMNKAFYTKYLCFKVMKLPFRTYMEFKSIKSLSFIDEKDNCSYYRLVSIVYEIPSQNKLITILSSEEQWHKVDSSNISSSKSLLNLLPTDFYNLKSLLIYTKVRALTLKLSIEETCIKPGNQIRCEPSDDIALCFINISLQSLLNLRSFLLDINSHNFTQKWGKELKKIVCDELKQTKPGTKVYNLSMFREYFIEEIQPLLFNEKDVGSSARFILDLLNAIHNSGCDNSNLCPACKNFLIKGKVFSRNSSKPAKNYEGYKISQKIGSSIDLKNQTLSTYGQTPIEFDLQNPPKYLMIIFQNSQSSQNKSYAKDYIKKNIEIKYQNHEKTYIYQLKTIILCCDGNFKFLQYSQTYQSWALICDPNIKPLLISLDDILLEKSGYIPEGLIYSQELHESIIKSYISNMLISFSNLEPLIKSLEDAKNVHIFYKHVLEYIKQVRNIEDNGIMPEISKEILLAFKKVEDIQSFENVLADFLEIVHEIGYKKQNMWICDCIGCKVFCSKVEKVIGNSAEYLRKIGTSITARNVQKQMKALTMKFESSAFMKRCANSIYSSNSKKAVYKCPSVLVLDINPMQSSAQEFNYLNNFADNNKIIITNSKTEGRVLFTINSIILSSCENTHQLSCIWRFTHWDIYKNGHLEKVLPNISSLSTQSYNSSLAFYNKHYYQYIITSLKFLYYAGSFRSEFLSYKNLNSEWVLILKHLLDSKDNLKNDDLILYFEHCFNSDYQKLSSDKSKLKLMTNYNLNSYDIEHVTNIIISRIHEESVKCSGDCPSCKSFLIKGRITNGFPYIKSDKLEETQDKWNGLKVIRLENWVKSGRKIGGKKVSMIKGQNKEYFAFELDELPNMIWYVLRYEKEEKWDTEKILKMCMNNVKDNEFINIQANHDKCTYRISIIVFHIKNCKDKYLFANFRNDIKKWELNNEICVDLDELIAFVRIYQVRNEYFPAMLLYEKNFY